MNKTYVGVSTLIGTIIGAGILGIPYVVMLSGFPIGLAHLAILGIIMTLISLYLGEIILRTKGDHQLAGYANKYLGKYGKIIMFLAFVFGIYSALLAYLIGEGESLSFLFFNSLTYKLHFAVAFWILLTSMAYHGIKALEEGETVGISIIALLVIGIIAFFWNKIDIKNLSYTNTTSILVPFGVILFAYLGFAALPEVSRILKKEKKSFKKTILLSYLSVFIIYTIFSIAVLGSQGKNTPQLATLALGKIFILLGILTLFTSYLGLSIALINSFRFDLKQSRAKAWLYTSILPIIIFILLEFYNLATFTKVLSIGGVISGGLTGVLILLMVNKAKIKGDRKPEYQIPYSRLISLALILLFIAGAITEIL